MTLNDNQVLRVKPVWNIDGVLMYSREAFIYLPADEPPPDGLLFSLTTRMPDGQWNIQQMTTAGQWRTIDQADFLEILLEFMAEKTEDGIDNFQRTGVRF